MEKKCEKLWHVGILVFVLTVVTADTQKDDTKCLSSFTAHTIPSETNVTKTECARLFTEGDSWDAADMHCKLIFGNLSAKIYENSSLHEELSNNGIRLLWMNIRRRPYFFVNTSSELFKENTDVWGNFWAEGEPRLYDCVALNITDGSLFTMDCKSKLPFVCTKGENDTSYRASRIDCPDEYTLSIPLSTNPYDTAPGRKCSKMIPIEKNSTFSCEREGSHEATHEEYAVLEAHNEMLYWNPEIFEKLLVCVKRLELENVTVYITMDKERLSDTTVKLNDEISQCEHILQCETNIPEEVQRHRLVYKWYKDDLPIADCYIHLCKLEYLTAAMKWHKGRRNWPSIQGSYHCEVRLIGLIRTYSSPRIEVFFGDTASYVIDIHGIKYNNYMDFSHDRFKNSTEILWSNIEKLLKEKDGFPGAVYDFQSLSVKNGSATMKVSIYVKRTKTIASTGGREAKEFKDYNKMKNLFENNASIFSNDRSISLSVSSADVCFSTAKHLLDGYCSKISTSLLNTWKKAADSPSVVCLDEYGKLITRRCVGSFTSKAEWSPFNCSLCKKFYEAVPDLQFECPDGFSNLNERELCYKIFNENEKSNWNDAYETCSNSSSYLMNDLYDIGLSKYWLSYKYSYGKIQGVGMRPRNEILQKVSIRKPELHCVSAVLENDKYKLQLENCSEKMSFVCIQNPYELLSLPTSHVLPIKDVDCQKGWIPSISLIQTQSVKYVHTWTKLNGRDTCYYFDNNHIYNRMSSIRTCEQTFHDAKLLQGRQDITDYQYLKKLIYQQNYTIYCNKYYTWWINASSNVSTNYADWSPYGDYSIEKQRTITLFSDQKIYWTLSKEESELGLICEMQKCEDDRPTKAYIEDRTVENQLGGRDSHGVSNFKLKCVPSGWFLTSSVRWYKDGILLNTYSRDFHFSPNTYNDENISSQKALNYQGYYSCSVDGFSPIKTVYSSGKLFKVKGFHTFVLMMASKNEAYINECVKCMATEKLCENNSLANCFKQNFKSVLDKSFHFLIKNLTCNSTHLNVIVHVYYEEKDRKEEDILKEIQTTNFNKFCEICSLEHTITSQSSEKCFRETSILKNANVTWPTIAIGEKTYTENMCSLDGRLLVRECLGDFNLGAVWSEVSGDKCTVIKSEITKGLHKILAELHEQNVESLPELLELTSSPEKLQSEDVGLIEQILNNLANLHSLTNAELKIAVKVISNLINTSPGVFEEKSALPSQIIEHLEQMTSNIEVDYSEINVSAENMHVNIYPFSPGIDSIPNCIVLRNGSTEALFNASSQEFQRNRNVDAGIIFPQGLISEHLNASDRLIYTIAKDFSVTSDVRVVSFIVSATLPNVSLYEFPKDEVTLFFRLFEERDEEKEKVCSKNKKKTERQDSPECVYWDDNIRDWSYKGCFRRAIKNDFVICVCNHLSRFAVILGVDSAPVSHTHEKVLSYITWIGCTLSCLGFAIIIVTFIIFRDFRKYLKNKVLFNYSICQFMFLIIFMTSIDQTSSKVYCKVAAILSHYFLLSSFAWMIALAYTVYLSLVKILGTYIPRLMQKLMAFAWGVSAIIVIIVLSINIDYYSQDNICWICRDVIAYAVTTPLIVMLIINYAIFGKIAYRIFENPSLGQNQERKNFLYTRIKALFCTSILLGLSWIFGVFSLFGDAKLAFQYLFSITTPLHGFLLAISFVIRPKCYRELWLKLLSPSMYSTSHSMHSTTASHKEENSRTSRYENALDNVVFRANSAVTLYR